MGGRTLIVSNDFGPRTGGIEAFVQAMASRLGDDMVVVHTAHQLGDVDFDRGLPYPVVRDPEAVLLPTRKIAARCAQTARYFGCDRVWFGAAAPLALMTPALRPAGIRTAVATTHSHEEWWSLVPAARKALRAIGERVDVVTYLGEHSRARLAQALSPAAVDRMRRLSPGVDVQRYHPDLDGAGVRERLALSDRPVTACISRVIPRKGQDVLVEVWPQVLRQVPGAALLLVGDGPHLPTVRRAVAGSGLEHDVILTGAVPWEQTPEYYAAADVFAMPTRTRLRGLEPEGVPLCFLEAQACGLPVVAGDSGGAPDTMRDGVTGHLVDGRDREQIVAAVVDLLTDPDRARQWGRAGRAWVSENFQWDDLATTLAALLAGEPAPLGKSAGRRPPG